eukprot:3639465-Amphidinium_carterae.1
MPSHPRLSSWHALSMHCSQQAKVGALTITGFGANASEDVMHSAPAICPIKSWKWGPCVKLLSSFSSTIALAASGFVGLAFVQRQ